MENETVEAPDNIVDAAPTQESAPAHETLQTLFAKYDMKAGTCLSDYMISGILQLVDEDKVEMDALTFWGFMDKLSWRAERSPLLYDSMYQPKYAYYGAMQIKEQAGFEE